MGAARSQRASAAPERHPRRLDPLRKMRGDSSVGGFAGHASARLGFFLAFGIEWYRGQFAAGFLQKDLHFSFGLFEVFLAIARELHAFLEKFHSFVERKVRALELSHN